MSIAQGSGLKSDKAYIAGVAVVIKAATGPNTFTSDTRYFLKDHPRLRGGRLYGSLDVETTSTGTVLQLI